MAKNHVYTLKEIREGLTRHFGFTEFKSNEQAEAVLGILNGKNDVILNMAPKSGKSIAYQLPLLMQDNNKLVVVITPLIALIYNHIRTLKSRNIDAETITVLTDYDDRDDILSRLEKNKTKFLYITPEMASKTLKHDDFEFLTQFKQKISYFVFDEAQTMFLNDYNFREDLIKLNKLRQEFKEIKWIAASTYVPKDVADKIGEKLELQDPIAIHQTRVELLRSIQHFRPVKSDNEAESLGTLKQIISDYNGTDGKLQVSGIIFCFQWNTAKRLFYELKDVYRDQVCKYHITDNNEPENQEDILSKWFDGTVPIIVTTRSSFGLGINKENIGFVLHWDIPKSPMDYFLQYARITSTHDKRACHMFYQEAEYNDLKGILQRNVDDNKLKLKQNLDRIKQYGNGTITIEQLFQSYIDRPYFQPFDQ